MSATCYSHAPDQAPICITFVALCRQDGAQLIEALANNLSLSLSDAASIESTEAGVQSAFPSLKALKRRFVQ